MAEPQAPAAEARRILPNLIASEPMQIEPEPMQMAAEGARRPRRGRPPKAKLIAAEMVEVSIAEPAIEIEIVAVAPTPVPPPSAPRLVRVAKPLADLPAGERWKRRLGRWAR